jgi:predicted phage-related endonuclease
MTTTSPARWSIPAAKVIMSAKDVEQDRNGWLQLRTTGVTATDMRVMAGHGYLGESVYQCWRGKVDPSTVVEEAMPEQDEDARLHLGTAVEPVIRQFATHHLQVDIRKVGFLQSRSDSLLLASPDGIASDGGGVEFKMTNPEALRSEDATGQRTNPAGNVLPAGWFDQVQDQLLVSGWPHIWVCAMVVDAYTRTFTYWKVLPDKDYQDYLRDLAHGFWKYVEQNEPPPPDFENDIEIKARWPVAKIPTVTVDDRTAAEVARMINDRRDLAEAVKARKILSNHLAGIAGDAEEVRDEKGNLLYRWGNVAGKVLDKEALARDYPELNLESYKIKVPVSHRALWIPGQKD